ncbi:hypothetical protein GCM10011506_01490 [Marivirga lumbricoides]|uniref:PKD domain-containing protein n=1 Tax=Marivirga lumbricoides TaxID=1046115 RepID=A0ABQ1L631_9BACT|nr:hypothetical protein GCM10011506_01490 [Marivirga lumbricoides]
MKNLFIILSAFVIAFTACESHENELPSIDINQSDLNFVVTQNPEKDNEVTMESTDKSVIPYWEYTKDGEVWGFSNKKKFMVNLPFLGTYSVNYHVLTGGGTFEAEPVQITVTSNDEEFFSAEEWGMLTGGVEGKTWVLNMESPMGFGGLDFPYNEEGADYWNWYPDLASNDWIMEDKNWGEMTFDLNGSYNVSVTQTALNSSEQTTKKGSFNYDIEEHSLIFNGGVEMLIGGDHYPDASTWSNVEIIELSDSTLRLATIRDQSRTGEGLAKLIFHYKPKE